MEPSAKKQVFYIHGGESFKDHELFLERLRSYTPRDLPGIEPRSKWTASFAEQLGSLYEVFMPQMPNKQNARYEEWKIWFERHFEHLRDGVVLVGCSLGGMFLLRYCSEETLPFTVKSLVLMAVPLPLPELDTRDCGDFLCSLEKVPKVFEVASEVVIMHSTDDFLVPYNHAVELKSHLPAAKLITFEDKNHFLVPELPELVDLIKGLG
jgi:predicted alpha/beta hydrolase family esterase